MRLEVPPEAAFVDPAGVPGEGRGVADFENRNVGERIKALRQQRGWSAERVARESGGLLDRTAIWKVENAKRRLKLEEAVVLAKVFGVQLKDLTDSGQGPAVTDKAADKPVEPESFAPEPAEPFPIGHLRGTELATLVDGLTRSRGPHFWLVTAPPGFGKTALLYDLCTELERGHNWATKLLDVRRQAAEFRDSPMALLTMLTTGKVIPDASDPPVERQTGSGMAASGESEVYRAAAQHVSKGGKPFLCALDSAELLSRDSARSLRAALNQVSTSVAGAGNPDVRLAFVVASRLDVGWRGVTPQPQLSVLPLAEFSVETVERRLRDVAGDVRAANITASRFRCIASSVHQVTAGMPELLRPALNWIEDEQWIDTDRLRHRAVFELIVAEFVTTRLLAVDSLSPQGDLASEEGQAVLKKAVSLLVRYRFFTQAHVRHSLESDEEFKQAFDRFGGDATGLWVALSRTALLARPLDEPWQEFHPAVRRLLFRYFYPTDEACARAHEEAGTFVADWVAKQAGTDQVTGLIEGLWHEAEMLRFRHAAHPAEMLRDQVAMMHEAVRETEAFSATELRDYAADMIIADMELRESIGGSVELQERLAGTMAAKR